ncbi:MAG: hypothetical protein MSH21_06995 [Clostridium sp.]|nr:hypothetical protein [Lachnospiraceae bacterium]MCI6654986.1 hypothetical protein [Clostridium sp.]
MAIHINNMDELARALQPTMVGLVNQLADEVYKTLNYFLSDYYTGWTPQSYQRTRDFLYSAVKTDVKIVRGKAVASVYIDYESMDDYVSATGFQVATWANTGYHGGLSVSHKPHVWDDTMDETINNGSLLHSAVSYLRSNGFSVRT